MKYKEGDVKVFKSCIHYLQRISLFPQDGQSFNKSLLLKYVLPKCIFGFPIFIGMLGHLYQSYKRKNILGGVNTLYGINFFILYYSSSLLAFYYGDRLLNFFYVLSEKKPESLGDYEYTIKKIDRTTKVVYYFVFTNGFLLGISGYQNDSFCDEGSVDNPQYVCRGIAQLWFPIEMDKKLKLFLAVYTLIFVQMQVPNMASFISVYFSSYNIVLRIHHVVYLLKQLEIEKDNVEETRAKLICCVKYYIEVSSLVRKMNDTVGFILVLNHNVYNIFMIGLNGFLVVEVGDFANTFQLVIWLALQYLACHSGQSLEDASLLLRDELYDISWYNMDPTLMSTFKIFQKQVDCRFHLKIQPLYILNMSHFAEVVKGIYTFVMFLQKVTWTQ